MSNIYDQSYEILYEEIIQTILALQFIEWHALESYVENEVPISDPNSLKPFQPCHYTVALSKFRQCI